MIPRATSLLFPLFLAIVTAAQSPQNQQLQQKPKGEEPVIRISTQLVQIDVAVTDKNDQIMRDLKLENFELFEDGKKQELKFIEFVDVNSGKRSRSARPNVPETETPSTNLTAASLKRVIAFVVDDLTIPNEDMIRVRQMLNNFVNNQMAEGDLVAIVRTVGGRGLLEQFTQDRELLQRAISTLTPASHPFSRFDNPGAEKIRELPVPSGGTASASVTDLSGNSVEIESATDETNQTARALSD